MNVCSKQCALQVLRKIRRGQVLSTNVLHSHWSDHRTFKHHVCSVLVSNMLCNYNRGKKKTHTLV